MSQHTRVFPYTAGVYASRPSVLIHWLRKRRSSLQKSTLKRSGRGEARGDESERNRSTELVRVSLVPKSV
jgi:hypothetical protein